MNQILNALKTPFVTLPPEEVPSSRTVAVVWGVVGVLIAKAL